MPAKAAPDHQLSTINGAQLQQPPLNSQLQPLNFLVTGNPLSPLASSVILVWACAIRRKAHDGFNARLGLSKSSSLKTAIAVGNENVTIVLFKGKLSPKTLGHMSFHLPEMAALRKALDHLKKHEVDLEDPGNEIGPGVPGSPHTGLWFLDGYRWEVSVQGGQVICLIGICAWPI